MKSFVRLAILAALLAESYALPATTGNEVEVALTQYHATCATDSAEIQAHIKSRQLSLLTGRRWPDEFTWSGGFYLTPDRDNAVAFGADFRSYCVADNRGGVVIMEFSFDTSDSESESDELSGNPTTNYTHNQTKAQTNSFDSSSNKSPPPTRCPTSSNFRAPIQPITKPTKSFHQITETMPKKPRTLLLRVGPYKLSVAALQLDHRRVRDAFDPKRVAITRPRDGLYELRGYFLGGPLVHRLPAPRVNLPPQPMSLEAQELPASVDFQARKITPLIKIQGFFDEQFKLGDAIREYLCDKAGLPNDETCQVPISDEDQIADMRKDTSSPYSVPSNLWSSYDDLARYDVISGTVPMQPDQKQIMDVAVTEFGMPAIQDPFIQVVLVTNNGKQPFL
ncbi:hypothetical protein B0H11DRAFT_2211866 [Mycena galericulata]|nr:hypothetical protein B0H11DRAFT_2211866 [Mycena galericulata]